MTRLELLNYLAERINAICVGHPIRVAIDGVDGSGKTTLADELAEVIERHGRPAIRALVDSFIHLLDVRYRRGRTAESYFFDAFDYDAVRTELLEPLGSNGHRQYRTAVYDMKTETVVSQSARHASNDDVLVLDGVFLHRDQLRPYWDFSIWLDVPFRITVPRAVARDALTSRFSVDVIQQRYTDRYVPAQIAYIRNCRPQQRASVSIDNSNPSEPKLIRSAC
jgi:uridine kinase